MKEVKGNAAPHWLCNKIVRAVPEEEVLGEWLLREFRSPRRGKEFHEKIPQQFHSIVENPDYNDPRENRIRRRCFHHTRGSFFEFARQKGFVNWHEVRIDADVMGHIRIAENIHFYEQYRSRGRPEIVAEYILRSESAGEMDSFAREIVNVADEIKKDRRISGLVVLARDENEILDLWEGCHTIFALTYLYLKGVMSEDLEVSGYLGSKEPYRD